MHRLAVLVCIITCINAINVNNDSFFADCLSSSGGIEALCFQDLVALNPFAKSFRIGGAAYSMLSTAPLSVLGLCLIAGSLEVSTATDTGRNHAELHCSNYLASMDS